MTLESPAFEANIAKMLVVIGVVTVVGNAIGYGVSPVEAAPGMALIAVIGFVSLLLGRHVPLEFPAFAYATVIGLVLSLPFSPVQELVLSLTDPVQFLATTTPILAYAGLSIGLQVTSMKRMSWKIVVVAICAFTGTFVGSALIAQVILSYQGLI